MRRDLYPYSLRSLDLADNNRGVSMPKVVMGILTLIGGAVVASYFLGWGLSLLLYPLSHPFRSLIIGGIGYGVWRWYKRSR